MADENLNTEVENEIVDAPEANDGDHIPEVSPAEEQARLAGWVPKDEYEGDEHKWVDAGEFLRRGELFQKIDKQNREVKELRKTVQLLADHNTKIRENAFKEALASLKAQKKEAFVEGDPDLLIQIDEQIAEVKEAEKEFKAAAAHKQAQSVEKEIHPEFADWTSRNSWYLNNEPMQAFADALGRTLAKQGKSPSEVLKEVERQVKEEFPNKFRNPNKDKPGAVEGASNKAGRTTGGGYVPTDVERAIAKKFVRQGAFKTEQEYYKQLADLKKQENA